MCLGFGLAADQEAQGPDPEAAELASEASEEGEAAGEAAKAEPRAEQAGPEGALCLSILEEVEREIQDARGQRAGTSTTLSWVQGGGASGFTSVGMGWLERARDWLRRLNPKATIPESWHLPPAAMQTWEPPAAVLFTLTDGQFDPSRDVCSSGDRPAGGLPELISVVCATSSRHSASHPLLYENFRLQSYEPRELVVVHAGELPSQFFQECAQRDARVVYRFFATQAGATDSQRSKDEAPDDPFAAVLSEDDPAEILHFCAGNPWEYEISRAGWTRGMMRNIACCVARGAVIAHFDDGCLYAPSYLDCMRRELQAHANPGPKGALGPAAVTLSRFHTLSISSQDFRLVDLLRREALWKEMGWRDDRYNHGFTYVYTRATWEQQPFPDIETVGTQDSDFLKALRKRRMPVGLVDGPPAGAGLAACGWDHDAICGTHDAPGNINYSRVRSFLQCRGERAASAPSAFAELLPSVRELDAELVGQKERCLGRLLAERGPVHVCVRCNFGVALDKSLTGSFRQMQEWVWLEADASGGTRVKMTGDISEFSRAGGAVAVGRASLPIDNINAWLRSTVYRHALCRECGLLLGWRFEPAGGVPACASPGCCFQPSSRGWVLRPEHRDFCCVACAEGGPSQHGERCERRACPKPAGPVSWGLVRRHLRRRAALGEPVPRPWAPGQPRRHEETELNAGRSDVCPKGHRLALFCAIPLCGRFACDVCDGAARAGDHLWGCGTCDYDVCEVCRARWPSQPATGHGEATLGAACPMGHRLQPFLAPPPDFRYVCDACDRPARAGDRLWRCGTCDFDMCEACKAG